MKTAILSTIGLVLLIVAGWLLSGSAPGSALAVSAAVPLPPCGTPQPFSGSITGSDPTHTSFLNDTAGPDVCLSPRGCPSITAGPEVFHYDVYTIVNPDAAPRQVVVQVNGTGCGTPLGVYSAAYLNTFNPAGLCDNWIASTGGSVTGITTYSFTVAASATFVIEVEEYSTTIGCASYGLSVTVQCNACGGPTATNTPTPANTPTGTPTFCPLPFTDVHPTDYFYQAVSYLFCRGEISGYGTVFLPYNITVRGQLCKIVVLAEDWAIYTPPTPTFRDVNTTNAFYQYVETAYSHSVISGYSCGVGCLEFRPSNNVTRAQMCKVMTLAEGWKPYTPPSPTFRDVPPTDPFYSYIETAYSRNIISGYGCGTGCLEFRSGAGATRGQICKIVYNSVTQP